MLHIDSTEKIDFLIRLTMNSDIGDAFTRHSEIYSNLGNREPQTSIEAQAVIEHIRAEKGHLDQESLDQLHTLSPHVEERLLRIVNAKRETEAAYTIR